MARKWTKREKREKLLRDPKIIKKLKDLKKWNEYFLDLQKFKNDRGCLPRATDSVVLHTWWVKQLTPGAHGRLSAAQISSLESLNLPASLAAWNWNQMYDQLQGYAEQNQVAPSKANNPELAKWYNKQLRKKKEGRLMDKYAEKLDNIRFILTSRTIIQLELCDQLAKWRKEHPDRWPRTGPANIQSKESKLAIFRYQMRSKHRKNDLNEVLKNRLEKIEFVFAIRENRWMTSYERCKKALNSLDTITAHALGVENWNWIKRNKNEYENRRLSPERTLLIEALSLERIPTLWELRYQELLHWCEAHGGKLPTKEENFSSAIWITTQRGRFKRVELDSNQIKKLELLGIDLKSTIQEKRRVKWMAAYHDLTEFLRTNENTWPISSSSGWEKVRYNWMQTQRESKRKAGKNNRTMPQWRIDLLDQIDFPWISLNH